MFGRVPGTGVRAGSNIRIEGCQCSLRVSSLRAVQFRLECAINPFTPGRSNSLPSSFGMEPCLLLDAVYGLVMPMLVKSLGGGHST